MSLKAKRRMSVSRGMLVLPAKCATPTDGADATSRSRVSARGGRGAASGARVVGVRRAARAPTEEFGQADAAAACRVEQLHQAVQVQVVVQAEDARKVWRRGQRRVSRVGVCAEGGGQPAAHRRATPRRCPPRRRAGSQSQRAAPPGRSGPAAPGLQRRRVSGVPGSKALPAMPPRQQRYAGRSRARRGDEHARGRSARVRAAHRRRRSCCSGARSGGHALSPRGCSIRNPWRAARRPRGAQAARSPRRAAATACRSVGAALLGGARPRLKA